MSRMAFHVADQDNTEGLRPSYCASVTGRINMEPDISYAGIYVERSPYQRFCHVLEARQRWRVRSRGKETSIRSAVVIVQEESV